MSTIEDRMNATKPVCGIVMPISSMENYSAEHWGDVLNILRETIGSAGFEPNLVSDADDVGIIQKTIVQNLYNNDIVICDVSGKNPNVMFELGMRLAFDKPTLIIKDDHTDYSFDTSIIEHVGYPRDLRFNKINEFKEKLKNKLIATNNTAKANPDFSTFLRSFGEYKVAQIQTKEISSDDYILESLREIKTEIRRIKRNERHLPPEARRPWDISFERDCLVGPGLEFVAESGFRTQDELKEHFSELLEYIRNDEHIQHAHESEYSSAKNVKELLYDEGFLRDALKAKSSKNGTKSNTRKT